MRLANLFTFVSGSIGVGILLLSVAAVSAEEKSIPYSAFVAQDRTPLRSGPGDEHYATDELGQGTEVEVHRRVEGGWLAIRPPESSFSWISQRDVKLTDNPEVAEVVGTATVSWIGSNVADMSDHRWLVKLDRGETVAVLGQERRRMVADAKSDLFYKIVPPSGEFRWLHEDDVVGGQDQVASKDPEIALADFRVPLRGTPRAEPGLLPNVPEVTQAQALTPAAPPPPEPKKDRFSPREKRSRRAPTGAVASIPKRGNNATLSFESVRQAANSEPVTRPETARPEPAETAAPAEPVKKEPARNEPKGSSPPQADSAGTGDLESQLRLLDAQLSLTVAEPAESWDFTPLRAAAEQLTAAAHSTLDRARVQLFLDKLSEFDGLRSRHALVTPPPAATSPATAPRDTAIDPRFDGTGWLLPVHSTKTASPPYALLDKDGNILQFVSPAPGLNLNRYLRKEIGVYGQKDQPNTLDKPHLTAHRIVELDRHRR